ncbi:MAG: hypothetical protein V1744_02655 [Candidatus Altiarchaeota archaeon]
MTSFTRRLAALAVILLLLVLTIPTVSAPGTYGDQLKECNDRVTKGPWWSRVWGAVTWVACVGIKLLGKWIVDILLGWISDAMTWLVKQFITMFQEALTMEPPWERYDGLHALVLKLVIPLLFAQIIVVTIWFLFSSIDPGQRAQAKNQLTKLMTALVLISVSKHLYILLFGISTDMTNIMFEKALALAGTSPTGLNPAVLIASIFLAVIIVAIASGQFIILLWILGIFLYVLLLAYVRFAMVILFYMIFPLILFLYFFEYTRQLGGDFIMKTLMWIFMGPVMALVMCINILSLQMVLGIDSAGMTNLATNPNPTASDMGTIDTSSTAPGQEIDEAQVAQQFPGGMAIFVGLILFLAGSVAFLAVPLIMTSLMQYLGGAVAAAGMMGAAKSTNRPQRLQSFGMMFGGSIMMGSSPAQAMGFAGQGMASYGRDSQENPGSIFSNKSGPAPVGGGKGQGFISNLRDAVMGPTKETKAAEQEFFKSKGGGGGGGGGKSGGGDQSKSGGSSQYIKQGEGGKDTEAPASPITGGEHTRTVAEKAQDRVMAGDSTSRLAAMLGLTLPDPKRSVWPGLYDIFVGPRPGSTVAGGRGAHVRAGIGKVLKATFIPESPFKPIRQAGAMLAALGGMILPPPLVPLTDWVGTKMMGLSVREALFSRVPRGQINGMIGQYKKLDQQEKALQSMQASGGTTTADLTRVSAELAKVSKSKNELADKFGVAMTKLGFGVTPMYDIMAEYRGNTVAYMELMGKAEMLAPELHQRYLETARVPRSLYKELEDSPTADIDALVKKRDEGTLTTTEKTEVDKIQGHVDELKKGRTQDDIDNWSEAAERSLFYSVAFMRSNKIEDSMDQTTFLNANGGVGAFAANTGMFKVDDKSWETRFDPDWKKRFDQQSGQQEPVGKMERRMFMRLDGAMENAATQMETKILDTGESVPNLSIHRDGDCNIYVGAKDLAEIQGKRTGEDWVETGREYELKNPEGITFSTRNQRTGDEVLTKGRVLKVVEVDARLGVLKSLDGITAKTMGDASNVVNGKATLLLTEFSTQADKIYEIDTTKPPEIRQDPRLWKVVDPTKIDPAKLADGHYFIQDPLNSDRTSTITNAYSGGRVTYNDWVHPGITTEPDEKLPGHFKQGPAADKAITVTDVIAKNAGLTTPSEIVSMSDKQLERHLIRQGVPVAGLTAYQMREKAAADIKAKVDEEKQRHREETEEKAIVRLSGLATVEDIKRMSDAQVEDYLTSNGVSVAGLTPKAMKQQAIKITEDSMKQQVKITEALVAKIRASQLLLSPPKGFEKILSKTDKEVEDYLKSQGVATAGMTIPDIRRQVLEVAELREADQRFHIDKQDMRQLKDAELGAEYALMTKLIAFRGEKATGGHTRHLRLFNDRDDPTHMVVDVDRKYWERMDWKWEKIERHGKGAYVGVNIAHMTEAGYFQRAEEHYMRHELGHVDAKEIIPQIREAAMQNLTPAEQRMIKSLRISREDDALGRAEEEVVANIIHNPDPDSIKENARKVLDIMEKDFDRLGYDHITLAAAYSALDPELEKEFTEMMQRKKAKHHITGGDFKRFEAATRYAGFIAAETERIRLKRQQSGGTP